MGKITFPNTYHPFLQTRTVDDANHNVTTTIRVFSDSNAIVDQGVTWYDYTAYGTVTEYSGTGSEAAFDGPLYCGYFCDKDTGLYQVRNRYYDPGLATFINRDPIGHQGGMNLYEYCGDNPINRTDASGLQYPGYQGIESMAGQAGMIPEQKRERILQVNNLLTKYDNECSKYIFYKHAGIKQYITKLRVF